MNPRVPINLQTTPIRHSGGKQDKLFKRSISLTIASGTLRHRTLSPKITPNSSNTTVVV
ncbi:MAG: hypothetical protein V7K14_26440 [Nostoc sp.]|uniref:hypothetical protein n=1 Tax=Nostoc sp. TaxID=1180 RepID=UPI002FFB96CD